MPVPAGPTSRTRSSATDRWTSCWPTSGSATWTANGTCRQSPNSGGGLSSFSRLIMFDKRGIGLSDPVPIDRLPTIEEWIDDLRAVMDEVASERAALVTNIGGAIMALVCAAAFPDRLSSLVVVDGFARYLAAPDYPIGGTVGREGPGAPDDGVEPRSSAHARSLRAEHGIGR